MARKIIRVLWRAVAFEIGRQAGNEAHFANPFWQMGSDCRVANTYGQVRALPRPDRQSGPTVHVEQHIRMLTLERTYRGRQITHAEIDRTGEFEAMPRGLAVQCVMVSAS